MGNDAAKVLAELDNFLGREESARVRARAEGDSDFFCKEFTSWPRLWFHSAWVKFLNSHQISVLLAPREHAKTMQITINETAQKVLAERNLRVLIVSDTETMSLRMGRAIKGLLRSAKIREVWGDVRGEKWSDKEFTLAGSDLGEKEASVTCLSVGGSVTSGHYDLVILDDVVDFENSRTQTQRDKLWDWFKFTLYPVAVRGKIWIIGTRYHWDDLYGRLLDKKQWPNGVSLLREKALREDGTALWPEQYSVAQLQQMRRDLGTIVFNSQYQNDAEAMKGSVFKAEWIKRYRELPGGLRQWMYFDLAISEKQTADYFAGVTVAQDKDGRIYVKDANHARLSFDEQFRHIKNAHDYRHRPTEPVIRVGIEANQYQAALANQLRTKTRVPVKAVHQHRDKMTRALRLQALFENSKIFFPMEGTEELESELLTFPEGAHDDLVDALAGACDLAGAVRRRPKARPMPRGL